MWIALLVIRVVLQLSARGAQLRLQIMALNSGSANAAEMLWAGKDQTVAWVNIQGVVQPAPKRDGAGLQWEVFYTSSWVLNHRTNAVSSCC